jgi:hypothetical protein
MGPSQPRSSVPRSGTSRWHSTAAVLVSGWYRQGTRRPTSAVREARDVAQRSWADAATGAVRMQCSVIQGTPAQESVVRYALLRNSQTSAVVRTPYVDTLTSIGAARDAAAIKLPGVSPNDQKFKLKVFDIMKRSSALSEFILREDHSIKVDLQQDGTLTVLQDICECHGHGWFTRKKLCEFSSKPGPKFGLSVMKSWIER